MPSLSNIPSVPAANSIKIELGYANSAGYLDTNGAVRWLQPGPGKTINSTPNSAIAFSDLAGAYLRDFEAYSNTAYSFDSVGLDSLGNIIVSSNLPGNPNQLQVTKLTPVGNSVWSAVISNSTIGVLTGGKIVCDWSDNIYLRTLNGTNASSNASLLSLDSNGAIRWSAQEDLGNPAAANSSFTIGNALSFVNTTMSQITTASGNLLKTYNTTNGTVNNYITHTHASISSMDIYAISSPSRLVCGSAIISGTRYPFQQDRGSTQFNYFSGTDVFPYSNDIVETADGYYAGDTGASKNPSFGATVSVLLNTCAAPYTTTPKTDATSSKITLIVNTLADIGGKITTRTTGWTLDYGSTRNVIGYRILPVSFYVTPTDPIASNDVYFLLIGYISGGFTSSIFVTAFYPDSGNSFNPPLTGQLFPWSYEIGSSDSSHDYEIIGPPTAYTNFRDKKRIAIPVKVSRAGVLIREGLLSLSLPNFVGYTGAIDESKSLSVTNEGTFPGVSVFPLNPTVTRRPYTGASAITRTTLTTTVTTTSGAQGTSNSVYVASSGTLSLDGFNFLN